MEVKEEASDVFSFDLFTPSEAAELLEAARAEVTWVPALVYGKDDRFEDKEMRYCSEQELTQLPGLSRCLDEALRRAARVASLCWRWPLKEASDTRLVRYNTGDFIGTHVDYHPTCGRPPRQVSMICYLNDGFGGGETVFPRQNLAFTPQAGKALLFPAGITHPHKANKVVSGTRYAIVSWIA